MSTRRFDEVGWAQTTPACPVHQAVRLAQEAYSRAGDSRSAQPAAIRCRHPRSQQTCLLRSRFQNHRITIIILLTSHHAALRVFPDSALLFPSWPVAAAVALRPRDRGEWPIQEASKQTCTRTRHATVIHFSQARASCANFFPPSLKPQDLALPLLSLQRVFLATPPVPKRQRQLLHCLLGYGIAPVTYK